MKARIAFFPNPHGVRNLTEGCLREYQFGQTILATPNGNTTKQNGTISNSTTTENEKNVLL